MYIELCLDEPRLGPEIADRQYDLELDDVNAVLVDVCRLPQARGRFTLSGFGQDPWPLDVQNDLSIFLEQLPQALQAIRAGAHTDIYFYQQGIERILAFQSSGDLYEVKCDSRTDWKPNPAVEAIARRDLEKMFNQVLDEFMNALRKIAPILAVHPWIQAWLKGLA